MSEGDSAGGFLSGALGCVMGILYLLTCFPGGTIFMAIMVPNRELTGLDWVLSVILPGFGLIKGLFG